MDKLVGYAIGGVLALLVFFSLMPTVTDSYDEAYQALSEHPEIQGVLAIVLIIFVVGFAWSVYKQM
jgi:hypothetical protein